MEKLFERSLFIFRRDFRLDDNTGLIFALDSSEQVIPAFIFTPEQIEENPYRSDHCLKFMLESLEDLDDQLRKKKGKLYYFQDEVGKVVTQCIQNLSIDALIINKDYTPYSIKRDQHLEKLCNRHQIPFFSFDDALLNPPENTLKNDGKPYSIFTPYFKNASKLKVSPPIPNPKTNYFQGPIPFAKNKPPSFANLSKLDNILKGGRCEALKILKKLSSFKNYTKLRDFPAEEGSTHLSPYLKFTLCSPREVYEAISDSLSSHHDLIRSLYWRDFFTSIAYFFPHVFESSFHKKYDKLKWSSNKTDFHKWCEGKTGFPIVDAGMREMNETGFMHNRVRMIAGSLLVKDLHINWRWGEKYFAQTLIDYDPAVNNGNWQWVASTGCDAQPYFRIFNPFSQQKKFDPDCIYIKKWVPELSKLSPKMIHAWEDEQYHDLCPQYPPPIANHSEASKLAKKAYQNLILEK